MIVVDYRTNEKSIAALQKCGMTVIRTVPLKCLYEAVNGHPDMQLHSFGNGKIICAPEAYEYYKKVIGEGVICGSAVLRDKYPYDIAYNAAAVGRYVICNESYTAPEIVDGYRRIGKEIVSVKQGYAKCSVAVVSDNAMITADEGIYAAMRDRAEVLKISPGHVRLDTMPYGFIGGCTGLIAPDILAVNGNIDLHPDGAAIRDFCKMHGVEILCLNDEPLYDVGTITELRHSH